MGTLFQYTIKGNCGLYVEDLLDIQRLYIISKNSGVMIEFPISYEHIIQYDFKDNDLMSESELNNKSNIGLFTNEAKLLIELLDEKYDNQNIYKLSISDSTLVRGVKYSVGNLFNDDLSYVYIHELDDKYRPKKLLERLSLKNS